MVLLGLSGMALFLVSVVALSIPVQFQESMFLEAWEGLSTGQKADVQDRLGCCGFNSEHEYLVGSNCTYGHPLCNSTELQNVSSFFGGPTIKFADTGLIKYRVRGPGVNARVKLHFGSMLGSSYILRRRAV